MAVLTGKKETSARFFPFDGNQISNPDPQKALPLKNGLLLDLKRDENLKATPESLKGVVVLEDGTGYTIDALAGSVPAAAPVVGSASIRSVLQYAGLALLGGLLLNLMPCVFPVLFIKGLSLVQSSTNDRRRMRMHGLVYALGILVSFWVVVTALLLLRAGGRQFGWGFQFQSPIFVAVDGHASLFSGNVPRGPI